MLTHEDKNPGYRSAKGKIYKHRRHEILGWPSAEQIRWYRNCAAKIKNGIIVEVGVYGGASLLSIVDICMTNSTILYGIDPWDLITNVNGEELKGFRIQKFRNHMKKVRSNLESIIQTYNYTVVRLIQDFSVNAAARFKPHDVDMVYIDGNHDYDSVTNDLTVWLPKLKTTGMLWGDDFAWKSVRHAVIDFCKAKNLTLRHDKRSWIIELT